MLLVVLGVSRMERTKKAVIAVCFIVLSILLVDSIVMFPWEQPTFSWEINTGDEFEFNVTAFGAIETPPAVSPEPIVLSIIANSTITVRIESLPTPDIVTESDFLDFISTIKVSSQFSNGSDIPSNVSALLNDLISRLFIPTGAWEFLDSLFPDNATDAGQHEFWCDTYFSRYYDTSFIFGHKRYLSDSGWGWYGIVSPTTGVPLIIETWSTGYVPPMLSYDWTFRLDWISS
jgi:hypothetical protein